MIRQSTKLKSLPNFPAIRYFVLAPSRHLFCAYTKQTSLHQADLIYICILFDGWEGNMAGYCMSVRPYFHKPQASENTAQECNIQSYAFSTIK